MNAVPTATIYQLDNQLRSLAQSNSTIAEVLKNHQGQFTTMALYQVAIALAQQAAESAKAEEFAPEDELT